MPALRPLAGLIRSLSALLGVTRHGRAALPPLERDQHDAAIEPDWQIHTARSYGARLIELDSGHSPFLTQPAELANVLSSLPEL